MSFRCGDCENFDKSENKCILLPEEEEIDIVTQANYYCKDKFDFGIYEEHCY